MSVSIKRLLPVIATGGLVGGLLYVSNNTRKERSTNSLASSLYFPRLATNYSTNFGTTATNLNFSTNKSSGYSEKLSSIFKSVFSFTSHEKQLFTFPGVIEILKYFESNPCTNDARLSEEGMYLQIAENFGYELCTKEAIRNKVEFILDDYCSADVNMPLASFQIYRNHIISALERLADIIIQQEKEREVNPKNI